MKHQRVIFAGRTSYLAAESLRICGVPQRDWRFSQKSLTAKPVEGAALALEGVNHVHGCDCLAACVLRVSYGIANDVLQENLEHTPGLFVDETGDTFHTATASKTADCGLGDTLDVIA